MSSTEEELGVPPTAHLPTKNDNTACFVTKSNHRIPLNASTSLRQPNPRCLIVGRQASTADIRIQHGSISRKHALLYCQDGPWILHDLGGKHGTHVNGTRIQGTAVLKNQDEIVFGTVRDQVFRLEQTTTDNSEVAAAPCQEATVAAQHTAKETLLDAGAGLTGRAKREAEIAAMMASLDQAPTYQKYQEPNTDTAAAQPQMEDPIAQAAQRYQLPVTERYSLSNDDARRHIVTCFDVDPSGARFCVGGTDHYVRFYDFSGLDRQRTGPFAVVEPVEGYGIVDVAYSNTGDRLLVGSTSLQPVILDRDGNEVIKFVRGDMYVTDQTRTTGHTAAVTAVDWHPLERDVVLTGSMDGSARLWNLKGKTQFQMLVCDKVFCAKNARGQRTGVTAVTFSPGGREFAVGTSCGSVQIWKRDRASGRPERTVVDAHGTNRAIASLVYNVDGSLLASRSVDDDTVKVWKVQRLCRSSVPMAACLNVPSALEHANCAFSGDSRVLCAGTLQQHKLPNGELRESGQLKFFPISNGGSVESVADLPVSPNAGVTAVRWHTKLNQIFVGCSDGSTHVLFHPRFSSKGAVVPMSKAGRRVDDLSQLLASRAPTGSAAIAGEIITPLSENHLALKRKRKEEQNDPSKIRRPEPPASGILTGGQSSATVNFTQFIMDSKTKNTTTIAGKDPREALFQYREGKNYVNQAYVGNKEVVLADKTVEEEEEEMKRK